MQHIQRTTVQFLSKSLYLKFEYLWKVHVGLATWNKSNSQKVKSSLGWKAENSMFESEMTKIRRSRKQKRASKELQPGKKMIVLSHVCGSKSFSCRTITLFGCRCVCRHTEFTEIVLWEVELTETLHGAPGWEETLWRHQRRRRCCITLWKKNHISGCDSEREMVPQDGCCLQLISAEEGGVVQDEVD